MFGSQKKEAMEFGEEKFKEFSVVVFNKLKQEYKQIKWDFSFRKSRSQIHYETIISTKNFLDNPFVIRIVYSDHPKSLTNKVSCYFLQTINGQPYGVGDSHFSLDDKVSDNILREVNFKMNVLTKDYYKKKGI